ncbi:MAG: 4a-hydroxytetrahydrobiopterin dehydratase [Candidatus Brennerbacteria bacterium]|nr:4a-hydroxytetrahydrobiopterin dehydratase [Candidatus Brennerbacteria bacterium]
MDLLLKKCAACDGGMSALQGMALERYLKEVKGWGVIDAKKIRKEFAFSNFTQALAFANKIGEIAETEDHHPDLQLSWGKVVVELWTHAIGGLSENDFILAAKIDAIN